MNKFLVWAGALAFGLALAFATAAFADRQVARSGNLVVVDQGSVTPMKLPKRQAAPITAHFLGEINTVDGAHPPAMESLDAEIDKTIVIDAVGLPSCRKGQITATTTSAAEEACGEAIIGSGTAEVEVAFPEQSPFSATGPLVLYNGGVKNGVTTVLIHAYLNVPAPTAVVATAEIKRVDHGQYGMQLHAEVPRIAGGSGSVTGYEFDVGRKYSYKGRKKSFLAASCPTGHFLTKGTLFFSDETKLNFVHTHSCIPEG